MGDYPSLDGFPVQTWGGVGSARLLQTRASLPPMSLSSKEAFREQRKREGSRFLHSSGSGRPSAYRTSSNMTSGVGKFHLMMADHMFQRRLETHKNMCVDDVVAIEQVVKTPRTVKTTFTMDIADAPVSIEDKSVNQTLKDAEAVLDL